MTNAVVTGYKGFSRGMRGISGKQYKENTLFVEDKAVIYKAGMHFCKNPITMLYYCPPVDDPDCISEYAKVEAYDNVYTEDNYEFCTRALFIGKRLSYEKLCDEIIRYTISSNETNIFYNTEDHGIIGTSDNYSTVDSSGRSCISCTGGYYGIVICNGFQSIASNSGDYGIADCRADSSIAGNAGCHGVANSNGDFSVAITSEYGSIACSRGYCNIACSSGSYSAANNCGRYGIAVACNKYSVSSVSGKKSLAVGFGKNNKVKGSLGSWIVCAEWDNEKPIDCKLALVDGTKIKADTFYKLEKGEFVEVK